MRTAETVLNVIHHWRAGCGESRTSGSEGGRRKSAPGTRSNSPAAYPTRHYQLIRNVLAAYHLGSRFRLICDARRGDLIDAARNVLSAVRAPDLLAKCGIVTWQEVARCAPETLQSFLLDKYGIAPSDSV